MLESDHVRDALVLRRNRGVMSVFNECNLDKNQFTEIVDLYEENTIFLSHFKVTEKTQQVSPHSNIVTIDDSNLSVTIWRKH